MGLDVRGYVTTVLAASCLRSRVYTLGLRVWWGDSIGLLYDYDDCSQGVGQRICGIDTRILQNSYQRVGLRCCVEILNKYRKPSTVVVCKHWELI